MANFARPPRWLQASPFLAGVVATLLATLFPTITETAIANGETRTLNLFHAHTKESISATYLVQGQYDRNVLQQLNWFLRDWRRDEPTEMDPRLFDVVWETYRTAGAATETIHVVSAYRSPETNAMLRARSRAVAKYSQHMLGKAMDTTMPGMSMGFLREVGMKMQRGGVGYYPTAGTPFVHLDVGGVRSWPRMNYEQLMRLFPDGKTVHLPTNNQPLPGYEVAKAEIEARNNGAYAVAPKRSGGFLAFLFGGGGDEEEDVAPPPQRQPAKQWAALAPRPTGGYAANADLGESSESRRAPSETLARAESNLPRGETALTPSSGPDAQSAPAPLDDKRDLWGKNPPTPPTRPFFPERLIAEAAPSTVASLTPPERIGDASRVESAPLSNGRGVEGEANDVAPASAPLPPRRPHLAAVASMSVIPLPPQRPDASANRAQHARSSTEALDALANAKAQAPASHDAAARSDASKESPADAMAYAAPLGLRRNHAPAGQSVVPKSGDAKASRDHAAPARGDHSRLRSMLDDETAASAEGAAGANLLSQEAPAARGFDKGAITTPTDRFAR